MKYCWRRFVKNMTTSKAERDIEYEHDQRKL